MAPLFRTSFIRTIIRPNSAPLSLQIRQITRRCGSLLSTCIVAPLEVKFRKHEEQPTSRTATKPSRCGYRQVEATAQAQSQSSAASCSRTFVAAFIRQGQPKQKQFSKSQRLHFSTHPSSRLFTTPLPFPTLLTFLKSSFASGKSGAWARIAELLMSPHT